MMEMRSNGSANKNPSVGRVKPMLRKNSARVTSVPTTLTSSSQLPSRNDTAQRAQVRRSSIAETEARLIERTAHVEALRQRVRNFLQQAGHLRANRSTTLVPEVGGDDEGREEHVTDIFSHMIRNSQPNIDLQSVLHEILSDVETKLKEDIHQRIKISDEYNEQRIEELSKRFEHFLQQNEYNHQEEVLELHGHIEYLQETLDATRERNELLEEQLEDANEKLLEKAEHFGNLQAEVVDLRKEVQELKAFKLKHKREMQDIEKLRKELEHFRALSRNTQELLTEVEQERDELREEFEKSLLKLRLANQRRNQTIEKEIDKTVDDLFLF